MEYIEHNLREALGAIVRMRARFDIPANSLFAEIERNHFIPNTRLDSVLLRKLRRIPGLGTSLYALKTLLREHRITVGERRITFVSLDSRPEFAPRCKTSEPRSASNDTCRPRSDARLRFPLIHDERRGVYSLT